MLLKIFKSKSKTEPIDTSPEVTEQMPLVPYRVLYTDLTFYTDPECRQEVPEATIVVLEALDPDGDFEQRDVVPAIKKYQPGQMVQWQLNHKKIWEKCWYRNPETGQIEQAWNFHVEFTGKVIAEETLKQHQDRLRDVEVKLRTDQAH